MPVTGNTDVATNTEVINPLSNNPEAITQTSTVYTEGNNGINDDEFCLSVNLTGANVQEQVNVALVIDTSGSTADDSGTDFDGDGVNESILEAELFGALALFDEYVAAGHDPSEISISLVTYESTSAVEGSFTLDQRDEFIAALQDIRDDGPGGGTNYVAGLEAAGDAFDAIDADPTDHTNLVVFMSDGFPWPPAQGQVPPGETTTPIEDAAAALESTFGAAINGIGLGANSSLNALNQLDNTGGANQVLSGDELLDIIVAPLTETDLNSIEITIEGVDGNGDPFTQTILLDDDDPRVIYTPTGIDVSELPIDPAFAHGQDVTITVTAYFEPDPGGSGTGLQSVVTQHVLAVVPCFTPGTMIQTADGAVLIENLEVGDRVVTRDHGLQPIRWIGATTLPKGYAAANKRLRPILIRKDALGPNQPDQDMRVSRQHRILVRDWRADMLFGKPGGVLVPAFSLCNDSTITEDHAAEDVTYIHIVFEQHEIVYADGLEAESFHPGARTVSGLSTPQRLELLEIFPQLAEEIDDFAYGAAREELRGGIAKILSDPS